MNLIRRPLCQWKRVMKFLALAVGVAGVALLVPGDGPAQAQSPHDANMTSQHDAQSGQATGHDSAQTTQHTSLSGQVTTHDAAQSTQHSTHDSNQTSQHDGLSQQITNLGDHSGLPQAWDKTLPANDPGGACPSNSSRFTCVMGGTAVRDNETGLVWERSPDTDFHSWRLARGFAFGCTAREVGGRKGWRLPSFAELASLVDPSVAGPSLPAGHPFTNVQSNKYWSATTDAHDPTSAVIVDFSTGTVLSSTKEVSWFVWCVRGAMNADQY